MTESPTDPPQLRLVPEPLGDVPRVYFSGPLTWYSKSDPERYAAVNAAAEAVEECLEAIGVSVHIPHRDVDHSEGDRTYWQNRLMIARSDLVVAFYDYPSTGMGQELEVAAEYGKPVVLLINERRSNTSTMVTTAFFRVEALVYDDVADIDTTLPPIVARLVDEQVRAEDRGSARPLGEQLRRRREGLGMSRATLAKTALCSVELIRHLEEDEAADLSPALRQLEHLAVALDTSVQSLLGISERRPIERRIIDVAAADGRSAEDVARATAIAARDAELESDEAVRELFAALDSVGDDGKSPS